jgi:pyruvate formate lyase activating enzyme
MQPEFLGELLEACRRNGIHTAVETCGYGPTGTLLKIMEKVDLFLYDLKDMNPERHRRSTGVSNRLILKNLRVLAEEGARMQVRLPLIPGVNDDDENLSKTVSFVSSLPGLKSLDVLPYHRSGSEKYGRLGRSYGLQDLRTADGRLDQAIKIASAHGLEVNIGG